MLDPNPAVISPPQAAASTPSPPGDRASLLTPLQNFLLGWLLVLAVGSATLAALGFVSELIGVLVAASLIAFLLNYAVGWLQPPLSRSLAAVVVYLLAALVLVAIVLVVAPPLINQGQQLAFSLPDLLAAARDRLEAFQAWSATKNLPVDVQVLEQQLLGQILGQLQARAQEIASQGLNFVASTVTGILDAILVLVIAFYMLLDGERLWDSLTRILSPPIRDSLTESLQRNLQQFVSGQLLLGAFMFVVLTIAFWLLQVPFFLLFAAIIGVLEILPFIGATLGIATVVVLVVFINGWLALKVLAVSIVIQQVKDNLVAPRILGDLTGLSPVVIFAALLLGAQLGGLLGVILAIPLAGAAKSFAEVVLNPALPPQTGSFFVNPLREEFAALEPTSNPTSNPTSSDV